MTSCSSCSISASVTFPASLNIVNSRNHRNRACKMVGIGVKFRACNGQPGREDSLLENLRGAGTMLTSAADAYTLVTAPLEERRHWVGARRRRAVRLGPDLPLSRARALQWGSLLESIRTAGRHLAAHQPARAWPFLDRADQRTAV